MKELEQIVQHALAQMAESGQFNKIVEAMVHKSVEEIISQCFNYGGPFQKQLAEAINKNIHIDFSHLGLAGYNQTLLNIIKAKLDSSIVQFAQKQISEGLDQLFATPPAEIKLSELVELYKKYLAEDDRDKEMEINAKVIRSEGCDGYWRLKLDGVPNKYGKQFEIACDNKGNIYSISAPYHGDLTKALFAGPFYGFERALWQMYAAKTKLVIDDI